MDHVAFPVIQSHDPPYVKPSLCRHQFDHPSFYGTTTIYTIPFYLSSLSVHGLENTPDQHPVGTAGDRDHAAADTEPGTPDLTVRHRTSGSEVKTADAVFVPERDLVDASAGIMSDIKRWIRIARACYNRGKRELYDMEAAPFTPKVRMLEAEMIETLRYECVTWTLGQDHFAELRTAHDNLLPRIIGFQRRQRTEPPMSYAKTLKKSLWDDPWGDVRDNIWWGEPEAGRTETNWAQCLADDLRVFQAKRVHGKAPLCCPE